MTTAITTTNGAGLASLNRDAINTIKATVAKGATDAELEMFMHLASRYGLDPFAKEIWCTKYVKQGQDPASVPATIIVSRDGYLKAAQQDPDFDGIASGVVKSGDLFAFNVASGTVSHEFGAKRGDILGAWAIVHHKRRRPVVCFADFQEYRGNSPIWSNYPSAMIQKVAEVHALKRQFGLSGIVSKEEMDYTPPEEMAGVVLIESHEVVKQIEAPAKDESRLAHEALMSRFNELAKEVDGVTGADALAARKTWLRANGVTDGSTKGLTTDQKRRMASTLNDSPHTYTQLVEASRNARLDAEEDIPTFCFGTGWP